jgi:Ca2+-binding EF-hand superfamily protein
LRAIAFIAFMLLAAPVVAQDKGVPGTARHYMERMDTDDDGRVSLAEYQDWMGYGFAAMDRDHDGVLAATELPGGRGQPLTREAHRERLAAGFRRQDRNGDGQLDARELSAPPR